MKESKGRPDETAESERAASTGRAPFLILMLQTVFRPGWLQFSLRTWVSVIVALSVAFWAQVDTPASAGVTVMILAQPLRGQALSKAFYRLLGTALAVGVSILLVSLFSQDRGMFLGGVALWVSACAFVGTLERDFRSYGALLAGYMVALVAVVSVDKPQNIFDVAMARASTVAIGVVAVAVVNIIAASPQAWRKLADSMGHLANRIRRIGRSAIMGELIPSTMETSTLASEILSLLTQISYARTELDKGRLRMAGARLSIIGMLTVLTSSRAIAQRLKEGGISEIAIHKAREWHERKEDGRTRQETLETLLMEIRADEPDYVPTPQDAYFLERCSTLISNRLHIRTGMNTLLRAAPAGEALQLAQLERNPDYITAFINAFRVLLGFSIAAGLCISSGQPMAYTALSQVALVLTLASTALDTAQYGKGAMIGTPLGIAAAAIMGFWMLPHVGTLIGLAAVLLPQTIIACVLLINPKTAAIGFNYGVFFLVFLGLGNHHSYDPMAFISRNTFYFLAAIMSFILLVLLWPPTAKQHRFRVAVAIARDLENQLDGRGEPMGPRLLSRKYDRLSQFLLWTKRLPEKRRANERVFDRFVELEDLSSTLARVQLYLTQAMAVKEIRPLVWSAREALTHDRLGLLEAEIPDLQHEFLQRLSLSKPHEVVLLVNCIGGLEAVRQRLLSTRYAVHRYGIGRKRW